MKKAFSFLVSCLLQRMLLKYSNFTKILFSWFFFTICLLLKQNSPNTWWQKYRNWYNKPYSYFFLANKSLKKYDNRGHSLWHPELETPQPFKKCCHLVIRSSNVCSPKHGLLCSQLEKYYCWPQKNLKIQKNIKENFKSSIIQSILRITTRYSDVFTSRLFYIPQQPQRVHRFFV